MSDLAQRRCQPCEGGVTPMDRATAEQHCGELSSNWSISDDAKAIRGEFTFKNYYHTTAFVNAVAWIAHTDDHHPDIAFGYKNCTIHYSTHSIGGLSENDFICAAKIDRLVDAS